jgi:hypothetical protein
MLGALSRGLCVGGVGVRKHLVSVDQLRRTSKMAAHLDLVSVD